MNKRELIKMYGAYAGARVFDDYAGEYGKVAGIDIVNEVVYVKHNIIHSRAPDELKLVLTPLRKISDEHLLVIGKIALPRASDDKKITEMAWELIQQRRLSINIGDKLRELEYDCGYGEVPSLIDANIALVDMSNFEATRY